MPFAMNVLIHSYTREVVHISGSKVTILAILRCGRAFKTFLSERVAIYMLCFPPGDITYRLEVRNSTTPYETLSSINMK